LNRVVDSRRLTGPHLLGDRPGAALDVAIDGDPAQAAEVWREEARRLLQLVGWEGEEVAARTFDGGGSLVITAPFDGLYAATDLNEAAWDAAEARLDHRAAASDAEVVTRLRTAIARERDPRLRALRDAARARHVTFLADDEVVSVGSGSGAQVWSRGAFPLPDQVDWNAVHDIPIVLVSGSNGKTTSARLIAAIATASGLVPALTSTDGVTVAGEQLVAGDYAGPMGARLALRDRRADVAVLETARGGILRRGLAVEHADLTLLTNIASDHLDDFGVNDVATLAAAKLVAARVVRPGGRVVLNADDPGLVAHALGVAPASWFALDRATPLVSIGLAAGGDAAYVEDGAFVLVQGGRPVPLMRLDSVPITLGGAAGYNVSNALGALLASAVLAELPAGRSITLETMASALGSFGSAASNPGRGNLYRIGGVQVLVDYGHNPHGLTALQGMLDGLGGRRRLIVLGQAGDRGDAAIRELARAAWRLRPDRIVLKELPTLYRGRAPGAVRAVLADELRGLGIAPAELIEVETEPEALDAALAWARDGDLIVMLTHEDRPVIMEKLDAMQGGR
jgi:UDP-N-acetylmuramyl tripeptide synthase